MGSSLVLTATVTDSLALADSTSRFGRGSNSHRPPSADSLSSAQLYSTSCDPNQTYFLAWQLELMPSWTTLAVQRFGEGGGPATRDAELTETELDWRVTFVCAAVQMLTSRLERRLEKGLGVATFYHPLAQRRLMEIFSMRRIAREGSELPSCISPRQVATNLGRARPNRSSFTSDDRTAEAAFQRGDQTNGA